MFDCLEPAKPWKVPFHHFLIGTFGIKALEVHYLFLDGHCHIKETRIASFNPCASAPNCASFLLFVS
jgi:hypothetical protein